jgi:hypothetical protein
VAVVSADDLERLRRLDEDLAERQRVLNAMRVPFRDVSPEEIELVLRIGEGRPGESGT